MKTNALTKNIYHSILFGLGVMLVLSIILLQCSGCTEKTDPYPPLREISVEMHMEGSYELTSDQSFLKSGPVNGFDSLVVGTEHIAKGQHWTLTLHKTTVKDSTIILVNRISANVHSERFGDTLKIYTFTIQN